MIKFRDFLEGDLVGGKMKLVGGKELATDLVADAVPWLGAAKSIAQFIWNNRNNVKNRINDPTIIQQIKQKISNGLLAQQFQKSGKSIDELVSACVGVTDESQSYLNEIEIQQIRNEVLEAANDGSINYGYAQGLVNKVLEEKANQIQNVIKMSPPQSWDKLMRSLNPRRRTS